MNKVEHNSVKKMWNDYLKSIGEDVETTEKTYVSWHFDLTESSANNLAKLVLSGQKRATASSLWVYEYENEPIPVEGSHSIITDWDGVAVCIIRTEKVEILPYNEVTEEHAKIEGEGDGSLEYWKEGHEIFFKAECEGIGRQFTGDMPVIFEEFQVVYK